MLFGGIGTFKLELSCFVDFNFLLIVFDFLFIVVFILLLFIIFFIILLLLVVAWNQIRIIPYRPFLSTSTSLRWPLWLIGPLRLRLAIDIFPHCLCIAARLFYRSAFALEILLIYYLILEIVFIFFEIHVSSILLICVFDIHTIHHRLSYIYITHVF
jgi:hypothetical protein